MKFSKNFDISSVVDKDLITLELEAHTKEEAIEELTDLLVKHGNISDRCEFINDVLKREEEGATGLGQGVAIPHGKSEAVKDTALAIGISPNPIPWESLDEEPVNVVILFAVRNTDANTLHIRLLQSVAVLLADDDFIASLHKVKSKEKLMALLGIK